MACELVGIRRAWGIFPCPDRLERFYHRAEYAFPMEACSRGYDTFQGNQQLHRPIEVDHLGEHDPGAVVDLIERDEAIPL